MAFNSSNSTIEDQIGGVPYFLIYLSEYLPYVILKSGGLIIGFFGMLLFFFVFSIQIENINRFFF